MQKWFGTGQSGAVAGRDGLEQVKRATAGAVCRLNIASVDTRERVDNLRSRIASALGDLDGIYFEREPEDEKIVSILEDRFLESLKRSKILDRQLAILYAVEKLLDEF